MNVNTQYHSPNSLKLPTYLQKAFEQKNLSVFTDAKERLLRILSEAQPYIYTSDKDKERYTENLNTLDVVKKVMLLLERGDHTLH
jgi:hypothetical protein